MDCEHSYELYATSGGYLFATTEEELNNPPKFPLLETWRCVECGHEEERPATEEALAENRERCRLNGQIHVQWHAFKKRFYGVDPHGPPRVRGYEMMCELDEFCAEFPDHTHVARIDDSYHSGSRLLFIEQRNEKEYWGTSVVVIPQCSGEAPLSFFMYPNHFQSVLQAMAAIQRHDLPEFGEDSEEYLSEDEVEEKRNPWVVVRKGRLKGTVTKQDLQADVEIARLKEVMWDLRAAGNCASSAVTHMAEALGMSVAEENQNQPEWSIEGRVDPYDVLEKVEELVKERDSYKRAKEENDERFQIERDEARAEVEQLKAKLASLQVSPESERCPVCWKKFL